MMSSLTDPLRAPQTEPPPRDRESPEFLETAWREKMPSSGKVEIRQRSIPPSSPPVSRKNQDHVYLPAGLLNQTPPQPSPPPEREPDKCLMDYFMKDAENFSDRLVDVAPARAAQKDSRSPKLPQSLIDCLCNKRIEEIEEAATKVSERWRNRQTGVVLPRNIKITRIRKGKAVTTPGLLERLPDDSPELPIHQRLCADPDDGSPPTCRSQDPSLEVETPPKAPTSETPSALDLAETPDTSACSSIANNEAGVESASGGGASPRIPSPWQEADDEDSRLRLAISISKMTRGMSEMLSSQGSSDGSPASSRTRSPETAPVDGASGPTNESGSGGSSRSTTSGDRSSGNPAVDSCIGGVGGTHQRNASNGGSDDGGGNEPNPKRWKPGTPEQPVAERRFACPYQKYDPIGSPFCCAKTSKNQEGGAGTFSRVKSHVLRNHDPFIRCDICWKVFRTEKGVLEHKENEDCIPKPSPAKYWMTREERDQVQQRRFTLGQVENWFSLFGILCPNVPADGLNGYKTSISPYFMDPDQKLSLDSHTPWPSHQPVPSQPGQDSYPTAPRKRQFSNSIPCQPLAGHVQDGQEATMDFSSLLDVPEADLTMDEPLPFDNTNLIFKGVTYPSFNDLLGNSSQPEPFSGPTPAPLVDELMAPPDPGHPSVGPTGTTNPSSNFLQLDNARLRNSNKQLTDEVQSIGKQCSEAQAQLRGLRDELRQLGNSLEGLLYEPSVQSGDREVMGKLFEISNTVTGISKSLGSGS